MAGEAYFGIWDYAAFSLLLLVSALVGVHFACFSKKKQNTTSQYLMGGKQMGVFPISMSLIASYISGISLIGLPAEMYVYGTMYWLIVVSEVFVSFTMAYVYIPVFYKLQITSSYEYLGMRFNRKVQALGSFLFVLKMFLYIPMVIYVPALAFEQDLHWFEIEDTYGATTLTGINLHIVTPIVCVICIFYTTLGGLSAVVWTDTIQMFGMVAGIVAVLTIGTFNIGFFEIIRRNMDTQRIEFDVFTPDITVRHTVWGLVFGNYFYWLAACSVNQAMVQRCLAMPTLKKARLAVVFLAVGIVILVSMCCYTGLVVFAHFHDCDPLSANLIKKSDQILPYYVMAISQKFPGLPGVFVSGVLSAALSTMSTGLNSMTGVIFQDLIKPNINFQVTELQSSVIMKVMVVIIGTLCVGMVFVVEQLGALIQAGKSLAAITAGPLLGMFSLGMFFPWANSEGALVGGISGLAVVSTLSLFSQAAIAQGKISFPKKPVSVDGCDFSSNITQPLIELVDPPLLVTYSSSKQVEGDKVVVNNYLIFNDESLESCSKIAFQPPSKFDVYVSRPLLVTYSSSKQVEGDKVVVNNYLIFNDESLESCSKIAFQLPSKFDVYVSRAYNVLWILKLSYIYYALVGVVTVLLVGNVVSFLTGPTDIKTINRDLLAPFVHSFLKPTHPSSHTSKSKENQEHTF